MILALPCAALSPDTAPSAQTAKELARLEERASASPAARRLLAATRQVPRREVRGSGLRDAIGVRGGSKPEIVLDALRLPQTSEAAAERGADDPAETPVLRLPDDPLARPGLLLHLFELEDLFALRAKDLLDMKAPPEGPYATLGGRRYPAPLVRAAFLLRGTGELERLRESLEAYDTVGLASTRAAINRWRRAVGK